MDSERSYFENNRVRKNSIEKQFQQFKFKNTRVNNSPYVIVRGP